MDIIAHRGFWDKADERNTPIALRYALESGFGFESDIRDYEGELVISHNIADGSCQRAEEVLKWLSEFGDRYCFAINIKADGLKDKLAEMLRRYGIANYFTFDMSVPQTVEYAEMGLTYFTRQSEVERSPILYDNAAGVWIDGFWGTDWITEDLLRRHIESGKRVCMVSPELHHREYRSFWEKLRYFELAWEHVLLCTDRPREAAEFFENEVSK